MNAVAVAIGAIVLTASPATKPASPAKTEAKPAVKAEPKADPKAPAAKACHPLQPLLPGTVLHYKNVSAGDNAMVEQTWTVEAPPAGSDGKEITVSLDTGFANGRHLPVEHRYVCDPSGALRTHIVPRGNRPSPVTEGDLLPPLEQLKPGKVWSTTTTLSRMAPGKGGKTMSLSLASTMALSFVGIEPVEVPAGKFSAYHVHGVITQSANGQPSHVTGETDSWYAKGVGLVKTTHKPKSGKVEQQLVLTERKAP